MHVFKGNGSNHNESARGSVVRKTSRPYHLTLQYIVKEGEENPPGWGPIHMDWRELPKTTRVGWRGPIMRCAKLKDLPWVYWSKEAVRE